MKNDNNYYVNGLWFDLYEEARRYADFIAEQQRRYFDMCTRDEIKAHKEITDKDEG